MIESLEGGGVRKFLLEREDKPEKWGGVDVEIGGCHFFYYFTVQFDHIHCVFGESKVPFITFLIFSLLS